jgi:hypothetical protein
MKFYPAYTLEDILTMPYVQYVELVYEMYRRLIAEKRAADKAEKKQQNSERQGGMPSLEELNSVRKR